MPMRQMSLFAALTVRHMLLWHGRMSQLFWIISLVLRLSIMFFLFVLFYFYFLIDYICFFFFSFLTFHRLFCGHFSSVFLVSFVSSSANAQHSRVCGIQPIQPSGLQQLQAGRKPWQQQSGNGRTIDGGCRLRCSTQTKTQRTEAQIKPREAQLALQG